MDYRVKIKVDKKISELFSDIKNSNIDIPSYITESFSTEFLDVKALKWFKANLKLINGPPIHMLLKENNIILPSPPVIEPSPEYKEKIRQLENRLKNKQYNAMTKNVDFRRVKLPEDTISYQSKIIVQLIIMYTYVSNTFIFSVKQINKQLIGVLQFVISTAAGFLFGFHGIELIVNKTFDLGLKLLLGITCALIIAIAEIYFLAKKLSKDFETPEEQLASKEHKD